MHRVLEKSVYNFSLKTMRVNGEDYGYMMSHFYVLQMEDIALKRCVTYPTACATSTALNDSFPGRAISCFGNVTRIVRHDVANEHLWIFSGVSGSRQQAH